jgi:hypothetical protein
VSLIKLISPSTQARRCALMEDEVLIIFQRHHDWTSELLNSNGKRLGSYPSRVLRYPKKEVDAEKKKVMWDNKKKKTLK